MSTKIHVGPKGGLYRMKNGKKLYLKNKRAMGDFSIYDRAAYEWARPGYGGQAPLPRPYGPRNNYQLKLDLNTNTWPMGYTKNKTAGKSVRITPKLCAKPKGHTQLCPL